MVSLQLSVAVKADIKVNHWPTASWFSIGPGWWRCIDSELTSPPMALMFCMCVCVTGGLSGWLCVCVCGMLSDWQMSSLGGLTCCYLGNRVLGWVSLLYTSLVSVALSFYNCFSVRGNCQILNDIIVGIFWSTLDRKKVKKTVPALVESLP